MTSRVSGQNQDRFTLEPHSTRIITLNSDTLDQVGPSSPFFNDLSFVGPLDSLRVAGYLTPGNGSPLPLRYYDPAVATSTDLTAVGIDTSAPTHVAVYNGTSAAYTVTPELRAATDEPSEPITVPALSVPAHGAAYIDIAPALHTLASHAAPLATLTLATTAPAGSLVGAFSEEKETVDATEDIPFRTSNPPIYMRGFYPLRWTSDYKNLAIVTNASPIPKEVSAYLIADGVTYNFAPVQLQPFATHVYDVDAVRENQVADFKGVKIPLSSRSGKFQWAGDPKDNNVGLMGRMEVLSKKDRRASSFSCGGSCPANVTTPVFSDYPYGDFPIGSTTILTAVEKTYDSYGNPVSKPLTGSQTGLTTSVPQVLSLNGDPSSTQIPLAAMSSGSSSMSYVEINDTYYPENGYSCQENQNTSPGGGSAVVYACPSSITVAQLDPLSIASVAPDRTGFGAMAEMQTNPTTTDFTTSQIYETITPVSSNCPSTIDSGTGPQPNIPFRVNSKASTFEDPSLDFPAKYNIFYDEHAFTASNDSLGIGNPPSSCVATIHQVYTCNGKSIASFTITKTFTHGTANGGPATIVTIQKN